MMLVKVFVVLTALSAKCVTSLPILGQDDWVWWCSAVQSNSPTVNDARAVANYIQGLGEQRCAVDRPPGSSQQVGVGMWSVGTATAVLYFTNNGDTVRGHHVEFSCSDTGYWLNKLIDNCQSNGRVAGATPMPNCWMKVLGYTGAIPQDANGAAIQFQ